MRLSGLGGIGLLARDPLISRWGGGLLQLLDLRLQLCSHLLQMLRISARLLCIRASLFGLALCQLLSHFGLLLCLFGISTSSALVKDALSKSLQKC